MENLILYSDEFHCFKSWKFLQSWSKSVIRTSRKSHRKYTRDKRLSKPEKKLILSRCDFRRSLFEYLWLMQKTFQITRHILIFRVRAYGFRGRIERLGSTLRQLHISPPLYISPFESKKSFIKPRENLTLPYKSLSVYYSSVYSQQSSHN